MYDIESNILSKVDIDPQELLRAISSIREDHNLESIVTPALVIQNRDGINVLWTIAHAATETGWGNSMMAKTKNNFFGFNAIDSDPSKATRYNLPSESVLFYGEFLKKHYLTKGGKYYNGATPHGVMVCYASAGDRAANTIVSIMNRLAEILGNTPPNGFPEKPAKKEPSAPQDVNKKEETQKDETPESQETTESDKSATGSDPKKN